MFVQCPEHASTMYTKCFSMIFTSIKRQWRSHRGGGGSKCSNTSNIEKFSTSRSLQNVLRLDKAKKNYW